jgi:hypothetical protein
MAREETFSFPVKTWTQLTNADAEAIRVQNECSFDIILKATVGAIAPSSVTGGIRLKGGQTITAADLIADLFPGVSGANRVYAWCDNGEGRVSVSHANV